MKCPYCKCDQDRVIDSRGSGEGFTIRRRRECIKCNRRFTTYERLEQVLIKVIKKDGDQENFDREKIRSGLKVACWKRPISDEELEDVITDIEDKIFAEYENEVETNQLGEMVMEKLFQLDEVALVRFASVYRQFEDIGDFVKELEYVQRQKNVVASAEMSRG